MFIKQNGIKKTACPLTATFEGTSLTKIRIIPPDVPDGLTVWDNTLFIPEEEGTPGLYYIGYDVNGNVTDDINLIDHYGVQGAEKPGNQQSATSLGDVVIPSFHNGIPVTKIEDYGFYGLPNATVTSGIFYDSMIIGENITTIGVQALRQGSGSADAVNIVFPNSLNRLEVGATEYVQFTNNPQIPANVTFIGADNFSNDSGAMRNKSFYFNQPEGLKVSVSGFAQASKTATAFTIYTNNSYVKRAFETNSNATVKRLDGSDWS